MITIMQIITSVRKTSSTQLCQVQWSFMEIEELELLPHNILAVYT